MAEQHRTIEHSLDMPEFCPAVLVASAEIITPENEEFTIPGLQESMSGATNTFFFEPEMADRLQLDRQSLKDAKFVLKPEWSEGRTDCVHNLTFGMQELSMDSGESFSLPIAVKPYDLEHSALIHELASFRYINGLGVMESFHPVGVWVDDKGSSYLLSHFEPAVISLDNVDWDQNGRSPLQEYFTLLDALERSAQILSRLHAAGFIHGDAQIKNMAVDYRGVRLVDLTTMRLLSSSEEERPGDLMRAMYRDISTLIESVDAKGFLEADKTENKRQVINSCLIRPYLSILRHPSSRLPRASHEDLEAIGRQLLTTIN